MIPVLVATATSGLITLPGETTPSPHLYVTPTVDEESSAALMYAGQWTVTVRATGYSVSLHHFVHIEDARELARQLHELGLDWAALGPDPEEWPADKRRAVVEVLAEHHSDCINNCFKEVAW